MNEQPKLGSIVSSPGYLSELNDHACGVVIELGGPGEPEVLKVYWFNRKMKNWQHVSWLTVIKS